MAKEIPEQVKQAADRFRNEFEGLRREIHKVIVGHHDIVEGVLVCLFTGGHALLEGVPGLGKTLLVRTLAESMQLEFSRIQFTPDLMPADIIGTNIIVEDQATGRKEFRFERGPLFSQIVLADEINRATPKTQSALLEAMQEKQVSVARQRFQLKPPFFVMATQNPIEQEGTYPLPEAQLDRFFFKLVVQYSGRQDLNEILNRTTTAKVPTVQPVMTGEEILVSQQLVRNVALAPHVQDYAIRLTMATHPGGEFATASVNKYVRWGSSPRGAQALVLAAKVYALMDGRFNVGFEDIRKAATPALRHRMLLNFEGEAEGIATDTVLKEIMEQLPTGVPVATA